MTDYLEFDACYLIIMKLIVTHLNPDEDAITSVWLVKRFFPGWAGAQVKFVPAGEAFGQKSPDEDPDIIHVDTGLGRFDHHMSGDRRICAATRVFDEIKKRRYATDDIQAKALIRMIEIVRSVDHAEERAWPDAPNDRYEFFLEMIFDGLKSGKRTLDNEGLIKFGMTALDGILSGMGEKIRAEIAMQSAVHFDIPWGKGIGAETASDMVHRLAERMNYAVVAVKNPSKGNVRVYAHPSLKEADLTYVYDAVRDEDPQSDWFLHASKRLLLNGSSSNPKMRPTKLSLREIINIVQKK